MPAVAHDVFTYLIGISPAYWFGLVFFTAPVCVFSATPENANARRMCRLILAIGLTYVFLNLLLHSWHAARWEAYQTCQNQFSDGDMQTHKECEQYLNLGGGAAVIFYLFFGWIMATAYVGIWEALWRLRHRKKIKKMGKEYKGRWVSNIPIGFAVFLFILHPLCAAIAWGIILLIR